MFDLNAITEIIQVQDTGADIVRELHDKKRWVTRIDGKDAKAIVRFSKLTTLTADYVVTENDGTVSDFGQISRGGDNFAKWHSKKHSGQQGHIRRKKNSQSEFVWDHLQSNQTGTIKRQ